MVNPKHFLVVVFVIALAIFEWAIYSHGVNVGETRVRREFAEYKQAAAIRLAEASENARLAEKHLNQQIEATKRNYQDAINSIQSRADDLTLQLRNRPKARATTTSSLPTSGGDAAGCTGAGLAGPDAEFLAGYAFDAAKQQEQLKACVADVKALSGM